VIWSPRAHGLRGLGYTRGADVQARIDLIDAAVWGRGHCPDLDAHRGWAFMSGPDWRSCQVSRPVTALLFVAVMVAVIVGVDLAFLRQHFWLRLAVNVGIVLVFVAFYFRFIGRPWTPWK
jgi:hypothetical protein